MAWHKLSSIKAFLSTRSACDPISRKSIQALMQETAAIVKEKAPKIYSKELTKVIFQQPYYKIKFLEDHVP